MKTTKQIRNNRISILLSLTAIILLPFISNAQLNVNSVGGVSVSSVTTFSLTGFEVHAGDINLNSATNSYQINGNPVLWHDNNTSDIFVGVNAGNASMTGHYNSFMGSSAGHNNTTGVNNVSMGYTAGLNNTSYSYNSAFGTQALATNNGGSYNSAFGCTALYHSTGASNTAIGYYAGVNNTSGTNNTFVGYGAGTTVSTGTYNTCVGNGADASAGITNATAIGNGATASVSNSVNLGNGAITKIYAAVTTITLSDGRFKTNVTENVKGLSFIKKLRPVTYYMDTKKLDDFLIQNMSDSTKIMHKQGMDFGPSTAIVHSGFIAQEVEKAAQQFGFISSIVSAPSNNTNPYGLGYEEFVVPLVKAVQELSNIIDSVKIVKTKQDSINTALSNQNAALQSQLTQLASKINACCTSTTNSNGSAKSLAEGVSQTNVNLNNSQVIILDQNSPNPFAETTTINYFLPDSIGKAQMLFYNAQGQLIQSVALIQKGKGALNVFANDLTNGIYTYTLVVDGQIIESKKMMKQ